MCWHASTMLHLCIPVVSVTPNEVNNALVKLGEDFEGDKYLFVGASNLRSRLLPNWIPASEDCSGCGFTAGVGRQIYGCLRGGYH